MTETVLYVGTDIDTLQAVISARAPKDRPNIYATTTASDAIDRLIDEQFDYLLIGSGVPICDVRVLLRMADREESTRTLCRQDLSETLDDALVDILDGTFDPEKPSTVDPLAAFDAASGSAVSVSGDEREQSLTNRLACVDRDGTYLWVNDSMAAYIERPDDAIVGTSIRDAPPKCGSETVLELLIQAIETGTERRSILSETEPTRAVGVHPIDDERFLLFEKEHKPRVTLGGQYLDRLSDLFFIVDFNGSLVYWNEAVCEVTGYSDIELAGLNAFKLFDDGDQGKAVGAIEDVRTNGERSVELRLSTNDGETIPYQFAASLVEDKNGDPQYVCGIGRDISSRVEMEAEIESIIGELRQSNDELERFAYVASHDLKEPLRTIQSFLELLESRYGDELGTDGEEYIEFAVNGADRMSAMIDDLLEYSRITGNVTFEPVDTDDVFEEVITDLQLAIQESNAAVTSDPLPSVAADKGLFVQLLQNLINNGIKHADDQPEIHVTADGGDEMVQFTVTDKGNGMADAEAEDIFELFSTGHDETGCGIGLATCKKIVESHGGSIWVESEKGVGSAFHFTLPKTPPETSDTGTVASPHFRSVSSEQ